MSTVTLSGNPVQTVGSLPTIGSKAPEFTLSAADLADTSLADFAGKTVVLNIFPSIDTGTCAASVRRFNQEAATLGDDVVVLCISRDLPFAQARFCGAEGLERVVTLSAMKTLDFGRDYGVTFADGPIEGLFSRSVVVVGKDGKVNYTQQVPETSDEPDYAPVLAAI